MSLEDTAVWPRSYKETAHPRKGSHHKPSHLKQFYWQQTNHSLVDWKFEKAVGLQYEYAYWNSQQPISWEIQRILETGLEEKAARDVYSLLAQVEELKRKAEADDAEKAVMRAENESFRATIKALEKSQATLKANLEELKLEIRYCEEDREDAERENEAMRTKIKTSQQSWASLTLDIINLKPAELGPGYFVEEYCPDMSEEETLLEQSEEESLAGPSEAESVSGELEEEALPPLHDEPLLPPHHDDDDQFLPPHHDAYFLPGQHVVEFLSDDLEEDSLSEQDESLSEHHQHDFLPGQQTMGFLSEELDGEMSSEDGDDERSVKQHVVEFLSEQLAGELSSDEEEDDDNDDRLSVKHHVVGFLSEQLAGELSSDEDEEDEVASLKQQVVEFVTERLNEDYLSEQEEDDHLSEEAEERYPTNQYMKEPLPEEQVPESTLELQEEPQEKPVLSRQQERELEFQRALNAVLNERIASLELQNARLREGIVMCWLYRIWEWMIWIINERRRWYVKVNRLLKDKYD